MPDEIIDQPTTQTSIDAPSALDRAAADIEAELKLDGPITPDKPADAPTDKPDAAKPDDKPSDKPADAPKPDTTKPAGEPDFEAEAEKTIRPNAKAWKVFEGVKKKWASEREQMAAKLKALESKPAPTAADDKRIEEYEKRIAEIDADRKKHAATIAELDYSRSEEYQQKHVARWERIYKEGAAFTMRLNVVNADGEVVRKATQADFESIRLLPPEVRRSEAKKMFGDAASDVVEYVRDLERIRSEADAEIEQHKSSYEKTRAEKERQAKEQQQQYSQLRTEAQKSIEEKYPQFFSPEHYKDQPELQKKLVDGYAYVDGVLDKAETMPPDERAAFIAAIRSRAAHFPLAAARTAKLEAEVTRLTEELAKFKGSDPGKLAGKTAGEPVGGEKTTWSIDDAAQEINAALKAI
jgi:hypothetical protein